jgi:glycine betaine/proline transport system permease protein
MAQVTPQLLFRSAAIVIIFGFAVLWAWGETIAPGLVVYPKSYFIPLAQWLSQGAKWLVNDAHFGFFTFAELTRFFSVVIDAPYRVVLSLFATGFLSGQGSAAVQLAPPLPWALVAALATILGHWVGGWRTAVLAAACFIYLAAFGQWASSMVTLASILVVVPLGVAGGLFAGVWAFRSPRFERLITPVLDVMQTIPVFAYLVPILVLFGFGPTAAIVATLIYAIPPMIRITVLALKNTSPELVELAKMTGCTRRQTLWRVLIPASRTSLMVGVNQVIMLSLNMVIIASMIGAGGLGFDVLAALRRLDIGAGLEAGFAIVALALVLDRQSQATAERLARPESPDTALPFHLRHAHLAAALLAMLVGIALAVAWPFFQEVPANAALSTGSFWNDAVKWINVNFFDAIEAAKNAVLLNVMTPFKRFLADLPWFGVSALVALAGYVFGGWRLATTVAALCFFIAATGQWEKAMVTLYLCGVSVAISLLIGIPIAIAAAERPWLWRGLQAVIDTLQTMPSFVYLMPAVMLFRVGDFTAMIAIVAYAIVPAIRYTVLGLQKVDPALIEAGRAMGCTPWQILTRIRLRLAVPEILLGVNQTIMFALSMLVITALVGTRDLGQEIYIALTKADVGRGLVAGLAVAAMAIIAERLTSAAAIKARERLGAV